MSNLHDELLQNKETFELLHSRIKVAIARVRLLEEGLNDAGVLFKYTRGENQAIDEINEILTELEFLKHTIEKAYGN